MWFHCIYLMQRIANHTRCGGPKELNLLYFKVYNDPVTGLTRAALVGERKQSVIDVERLFGPNVADCFRSRGYHYEVKYVEAIWNWRRACDHRGLSELEDVILTISFLTYSLMTSCPGTMNCMILYLEVNRYVILTLWL